ncbi:MAG: hypothetical protein KKE02_06610 [Alphaproteobacteria bacterium]|nr:hypothetical protein [Alphaproteobacteria bacterium]MBU1515433.1 hypothetical protein [Alphaproteobacteria bacterium]MBU2095431.1 hypothetical protein [Alphaproteobacteria bacterium]MBU2150673.1 hypothetical protein [Alphaproteobacteria bacterium]MBU2306937.1 hypothetical protein [Alphaproteobacteria bacterium]
MLMSAFAALVMFAAPETTQAAAVTDAKPAKSAEAKSQPGKTCYTATPSGSRMPRKVCVTNAARGDEKSEKDLKAEPKPE